MEKQISDFTINQRLLAPFKLDDLALRVGSKERGNYNNSTVLLYVDSRAVQKRLNTLYPNHTTTVQDLQTVPYHIYNVKEKTDFKTKKTEEVTTDYHGIRAFCSVSITIPGLGTRSNVGEEPEDPNSITKAYAQAFKRAASQFYIGAYTYYCPLPSVPTASASQPGFLDNLIKSEKVFGLINQACADAGFKFMCEESAKKVTYQEAANSIDLFGRVLSTEEMKKIKLV